MAKGREVVGGREYIIGSPEVLDIVGVDSWVHIIINFFYIFFYLWKTCKKVS